MQRALLTRLMALGGWSAGTAVADASSRNVAAVRGFASRGGKTPKLPTEEPAKAKCGLTMEIQESKDPKCGMPPKADNVEKYTYGPCKTAETESMCKSYQAPSTGPECCTSMGPRAPGCDTSPKSDDESPPKSCGQK